MLQLTRKELKLIHDAAACCTCGKRFAKDKIYQNVRDHCHYTGKYRGARHSTCNQKFNVPNQKNSCHLLSQWINQDYHFIIKELSNKFKGQFECLGKNRNVQIFLVPIENEIRKPDKNQDNKDIYHFLQNEIY